MSAPALCIAQCSSTGVFAMSDTLRLLTKKQVKDLCLYSFAHTARLEAQGLFPKRVKLGKHRGSRVGYPEAEIRTWLQQRINERSL